MTALAAEAGTMPRTMKATPVSPQAIQRARDTRESSDEALPPAPPVSADAWTPLPGVEPVTLLARSMQQCAWPVLEDALKLVCGGPVIMKSGLRGGFVPGPYCEYHAKRSRGGEWKEW